MKCGEIVQVTHELNEDWFGLVGVVHSRGRFAGSRWVRFPAWDSDRGVLFLTEELGRIETKTGGLQR